MTVTAEPKAKETDPLAFYKGKPVAVIRRRPTSPGNVDLVDRRGLTVARASIDPGRGTVNRTWTWVMEFGLSWKGGGGPRTGESRPGLQACVDELSVLMEERGLEGVDRIVTGPSSLRTFKVYVREGQTRINADAIAEALHDCGVPLLSVSEEFQNVNERRRLNRGR